ncbi:peptidylprolyl isomerase [Plebeiibacterium sediminum]|uniref:Periplasmic chaperone PpiD n=1 Tax=Plebeiibacterium sediminum TaxID=2992112 RepID=A0AAE3M7G2_9BACT|nr:peptidylprolyl isomerase [Plebeiobacterium sediminum]MCW3788391.1 SurA N-terminal domain-containing protein [Plebeiobacterium sediminum]
MATLERIRNKGGILVAVVIGLALFAFILGDFLKRNGGGNQANSIEVGEINGTTITYAEYQNEISQAEDFRKLQTGSSSLDENTQYQIRNQVWEQMVQEILMGEKFENAGIEVSTEEVLEMATGKNAHPAIRQMFSDPQTGVFNQAAVINFLRNRKNDRNANLYWEYIKKAIVNEKLNTKYANLYRKGFYTTQNMIESEANANLRTVDFDFVAVNYSSIPDSTIEVSNSEIKAYYNDHLEDYKQDAERTIEYISFAVNPSEEDKQLAEKWITDTKEEFSNPATDAGQFVTMNSDLPYEDKNLNAEDLRIAIKDFVVNGKVGDVYGPYLEDETYKLSRIVSIKEMPDSVRARHILIQEQNPATANAIADSLINLINKGSDFAELARKNSKDTGSAINGGDLNWFKEGMMVKPFNDACFNAKKGDVLKVETQFGVHIINIQNVGKTVTKYNVATLARDIKYSSKTYQQIYSEANKFAANNNTAEKFIEAIKTENQTPRFATLKANDRNVRGLENSRRLVQWAFEGEVNDMSPTIYEFGNQFVIAVITDAKEEGYQPVNEVATRIKSLIAKDKKAEIIMKKFADNTKTSQSLSSLAQKMESTVQSATNINFAAYQVTGAGFEPALIGLATNAEVNKISIPVKGNRGVYVVKVTSETVAEKADLEAAERTLTQSNEYKVRSLNNAIREEAEITDSRAKYF